MIKENIDGVEVEITESPRETFWNKELDTAKKQKLAYENNLEMLEEIIKIAENKLKEYEKK